MGKEEILEEIKRAEAEIKEMKKEARKKKEESIARAKQEAVELLSKEREEIDTEWNAQFNIEMEKLKNEKEAIIEAGRKDAAKERERAKGSVPAVVNALVEKFIQTVQKGA